MAPRSVEVGGRSTRSFLFVARSELMSYWLKYGASLLKIGYSLRTACSEGDDEDEEVLSAAEAGAARLE